MVAVLFLVCAVAGLAAAAANEVTEPIIAQQEAQALQRGLSEVLPEAASFEPVSAAELTGAGKAVLSAWWALDSGNQPVGVVVEAAPSGYGGPIRMLVGVAQDGTVKTLKILSAANETPGLGAKVTEPAFQGQFSGLRAGIALIKGQAPAGNEIQAVTGATISSRAVLDGVNQALAAAAQLQEAR